MRRIALLTVVFAALSLAAQTKIETISAFQNAAAKPAVVKALAQEGYRVPGVADIWFAQAVATKAPGGNSAPLYPQLGSAEFIGVIQFTAAAKDFRGQPIKPGAYTMRYELLPGDGNHMGAAQYPDFVLLIALADDPDPAAKLDFAQLTSLSAKAAGTGHPATFALSPPEGAPSFPSLFIDNDGFAVFAAKLKTAAGQALPFAVVLKGQAAQ